MAKPLELCGWPHLVADGAYILPQFWLAHETNEVSPVCMYFAYPASKLLLTTQRALDRIELRVGLASSARNAGGVEVVIFPVLPARVALLRRARCSRRDRHAVAGI